MHLFRQGALDLMQGAPLDVFELTAGFVGEMETLASVVDALAPVAPSAYMSHIALGPEVEVANAIVDRVGRCVFGLGGLRDSYFSDGNDACATFCVGAFYQFRQLNLLV